MRCSASPRPLRYVAISLLAFSLVSCEESPGAPGVPDGGDATGPQCAVGLWSDGGDEVYRWPEPTLLVSDPATPTGYRIQIDERQFPATTERLGGFGPVLTQDLNDLDGFGLNADAFFSFSRPFDPAQLPSGMETLEPGTGLGLAVLEPGPPRLIPVYTYTADEGSTIFLRPLFPLPANALVAAFLTTSLQSAALDDCIQRPEELDEALAESDAQTSQALGALIDLDAITRPEDLIALNIFPTQSVLEDITSVVADIESREYAFVAPPVCETGPLFQACTAEINVTDYRDEDGVFRSDGARATAESTYNLPITIWLPSEAPADTPPPTILFGHGLNEDRNQAQRLAEFAAPRGVAVVATPTLEHGEHPTARPDATDLQRVMDFFAVDLDNIATRVVQSLKLRENFRQSNWDRHQLLRLLQTSPDINGDGNPDIDGERLAYMGESLGGILGAQLLASTDALGAGVLAVPGGKIISIVSESVDFGSLIIALRPSRASESDMLRFYPILQTAVDRGDAASFGGHIQRDRIENSRDHLPSLIVGMALDDEIIPNVANFALGRAMQLPIVEPTLRAEEGFTSISGPLSGNVADGVATAGMLQFDRAQDADGQVVMATHTNVTFSTLGFAAWFHFLDTHWMDGLAEIRDPYTAIGFPE